MVTRILFAIGLLLSLLFVACSDGLSGMITDPEILRIVNESETLEQAVENLVSEANRNGGLDNITVLILSCSEEE